MTAPQLQPARRTTGVRGYIHPSRQGWRSDRLGFFATQRGMTVEKRIWKLIVLVAAVTVAAVSLAATVAAGDEGPKGLRIEGGATTMVEGGTGAPDFVPVLTKLAFHWDGKSGNLECLALAPSDPAGDPGGGRRAARGVRPEGGRGGGGGVAGFPGRRVPPSW